MVSNAGFLNKTLIGFEKRDYLIAKDLASLIEGTFPIGPIASVGTREVGFYLAFLLEVPWYGRQAQVSTPDEILLSNAKVLTISRDAASAQILGSSFRIQRLDELLVDCGIRAWEDDIDVYLIDIDLSTYTCPRKGE
jgi:hypothetical protein